MSLKIDSRTNASIERYNLNAQLVNGQTFEACYLYPSSSNRLDMCAAAKDEKPNFLLSIFKNKCPRCRRGNMFKVANPYKLKTVLLMNERCPVCTQPLDMEPGFYYGTNMISYTLAVLLCVITFIVWWLTIGFSLKDSRFFVWMAANAVLLVLLQPPLMRLSRAVWIVFFVPYSSQWMNGDVIEPERVNKEHAGNW